MFQLFLETVLGKNVSIRKCHYSTLTHDGSFDWVKKSLLLRFWRPCSIVFKLSVVPARSLLSFWFLVCSVWPEIKWTCMSETTKRRTPQWSGPSHKSKHKTSCTYRKCLTRKPNANQSPPPQPAHLILENKTCWLRRKSLTSWSIMLCFLCVCVCVCVSSSVVFDSSWPHGLCVCVCVCVSVAQLCLTLHDPWTVAHQTPLQNFPSRNTGVGCHFLLQGNYPADWTHGSCTGRRILYHCTTLEALKISNMWLNCFSFVIWHQLLFPL